MGSTLAGEQSTMLFVFGDGRHGHKLAKVMCRCNDKESVFQCISIVVDKKFENEMEDVKGKACKIYAIDFDKVEEDSSELNRIVSEHKYDWLVMSPCGDSFDAESVKCVSEVWKKQNGKNVLLLSMAKVDEADKPLLKKLHEAEKVVQKEFPRKSVILRKQMSLQDLDFFGSELQEKRMWRLPTGDGMFAPVCLRDDVASAICHIARKKNIEERFQGKVFTLTNKEKVNGVLLAEMTRSALKEDVKFESISIEEADEILKKFQKDDNRNERERGGSNMQDPIRGKKRRDMRRHLISNTERHALLAAFEMIRDKKYNFVTDHVKSITGKDPMTIEEYIEKHQENFKPGKL